MEVFIVDIANQPGEFARVTEALAELHVDITGFAGATCGERGALALLTSNEAVTRGALAAGGWTHHEIELVVASVANEPGGLARTVRRLAEHGVNIEAALATGMAGNNVHVGFACDDPVRAREALGEQVVTLVHA